MKIKNDEFLVSLGYAIIFLITCIFMCIKYYDVGLVWYDKITYFGLLLGLVHFGSKAVVEYKKMKKQ